MEIFLEILRYTIPSVVMLAGVYFVIDKIYRQESKRRDFEIFKMQKDHVLPLRLQAYERMSLFLQRIKPESMLTRFSFDRLTAQQLQQMLLQAVRDEFEHNAGQQVYVSHAVWGLVLNSRESICQLINMAAAKCGPGAPAMELASNMLEMFAFSDETPIDLAMARMRREIIGEQNA
ncbi:MAG: hypothetical protein MJ001_00925 [Paludibacteraceae bacterium]|nr:hypothetical protein [Candidatus Colousia faecequi]MCQ2337479.1 hypothetical protein [Paludibacteraceae bacterium]MCQ2343466.1 hypothetical protein [Paludibacteraceae bacterium]